jgi:hypothetical protein
MKPSADSLSGSQETRYLRALRASALLHGLTGIATAVVISWELVAMARQGHTVNLMGLPALSGPFERLGIERVVRLGWVFVGLSSLEVLAGMLLWQRRRSGAWLSMSLLPAAAVFWVGFALPGPPLVAILRIQQLWVGRQALR